MENFTIKAFMDQVTELSGALPERHIKALGNNFNKVNMLNLEGVAKEPRKLKTLLLVKFVTLDSLRLNKSITDKTRKKEDLKNEELAFKSRLVLAVDSSSLYDELANIMDKKRELEVQIEKLELLQGVYNGILNIFKFEHENMFEFEMALSENEKHVFSLLYNCHFGNGVDNFNTLKSVIKKSRTLSKYQVLAIKNNNSELTKEPYKALRDELKNLSDSYKIIKADSSEVFCTKTLNYNSAELTLICQWCSGLQIAVTNGTYHMTAKSEKSLAQGLFLLIISKWQGVDLIKSLEEELKN